MGRRMDSGAPTLLFWVYIGSSMIYRILDKISVICERFRSKLYLIKKACMFAGNGGVATTMVYFSLFYLSLQSRTLHRGYERIRDWGGTRS
ncbi:hypothetical protein EDD85DRAFT_861918 [Armillaria nabsnona]|nr:hypothetical protein EDD85DRAFT_861918 [Armillaria nabsnona]